MKTADKIKECKDHLRNATIRMTSVTTEDNYNIQERRLASIEQELNYWKEELKKGNIEY